MPFAAALILVVGCATRDLSPGERAFSDSVLGAEVAIDDVHVVKGAAAGFVTITVPPRPRTTCQEKIWPPRTETLTGRYSAMVLGETIYYTRAKWQPDFLAGYPDNLNLPEAMRFAHEMVHVWQHQRRDLTGYSPFRVGAEHVRSQDPYLIEVDPDKDLLDYSYEQQATLVAEFVCCRALDPDGTRTEQLYDVVRAYFPTTARRSTIPPEDVFVPWRGAPRRGICS